MLKIFFFFKKVYLRSFFKNFWSSFRLMTCFTGAVRSGLHRITSLRLLRYSRFFFKARRRVLYKKAYVRWKMSRLAAYSAPKSLAKKRPYRFLTYYWYLRKTKNNYFMSITDSKFSVKLWENSFTAGKYLGRKAASPLALEDLSSKIYRRFIELCKKEYFEFVSGASLVGRSRSKSVPFVGLVFMFNSALGRYKKFLTNFIVNRLFKVRLNRSRKRGFFKYRLLALIWRKRAPFNGCYPKVKRRRKNKRRKNLMKHLKDRFAWKHRRIAKRLHFSNSFFWKKKSKSFLSRLRAEKKKNFFVARILKETKRGQTAKPQLRSKKKTTKRHSLRHLVK